MLLKFITAAAWLWGMPCLLMCLYGFVSGVRSDNEGRIWAGWIFFVAGIAPWAWLIARYVL